MPMKVIKMGVGKFLDMDGLLAVIINNAKGSTQGTMSLYFFVLEIDIN